MIPIPQPTPGPTISVEQATLNVGQLAALVQLMRSEILRIAKNFDIHTVPSVTAWGWCDQLDELARLGPIENIQNPGTFNGATESAVRAESQSALVQAEQARDEARQEVQRLEDLIARKA